MINFIGTVYATGKNVHIFCMYTVVQ